ncbi:MAG: hypothetical protein WC551_08655 [Patescibacteria group bacterium]
MYLNDIPQFPRSYYQCNIPWWDLEDSLRRYITRGLDLNPEFQRGHVWTEAQQIAYVEYRLQGGESGRDIYTNCSGWMDDYRGPFVLVDGLQRIEAVRKFLRGEMLVFGEKFEGTTGSVDFILHIAALDNQADVLRWYINFNSGGTPHSPEEIDRVRKMLAAVEGK